MNETSNSDPEKASAHAGRKSGRGGGESGGGAYANPHAGKEGGNSGFMGHGGQTGMAYHGTGRLGDEETGDNANAPARGGDEEK